jgi:hypothetical protein
MKEDKSRRDAVQGARSSEKTRLATCGLHLHIPSAFGASLQHLPTKDC